jgi:hypothetical protein
MTQRSLTLPGVAVDFSKATVVKVSYPPRSFQLVLEGAEVAGRAVDSIKVTFEAVANLEEIRTFLTAKYIRRERKVPGYKRPWAFFDPQTYLLKLPAKLTQLRQSTATQIRYGDRVFAAACAGKTTLKPGEQLYYFALKEKRFKGRQAFPIVCSRLSVVDAKGNRLAGAETPPQRRWQIKDYEQLGMQYLEAILTGDLKTAFALLSKACQRRLGKTGFARRLADDFRSVGWGGVDVREMARRHLRSLLYANAENDDQMVWERVQCQTRTDFPRESIRSYLELGTSFYREALWVDVVEEDGRLRLYI